MKQFRSVKMMLVASFYIPSFFSFAQNSSREIPEERFTGKIKSIQETTIDLDETGEQTTVWKTSTEIDDQHRMVALVRICPSGDTCANVAYRFDSRGNRLQTFPEQAKESKFTYNEQKLLVEKQEFHRDGNPYRTIKYSYDEANRLICESDFNQHGIKGNDHRYRYDDNGNIIEETFSNDGGTFLYYVYTYDASGKHIQTEEFDQLESELNYLKTSYITDEKETFREGITVDENGVFVSKFRIERDHLGNTLRYRTFSSEQQVSEDNLFIYEYDAAGNWIKESGFSDGVLFVVRSRTLTYF